MTTKLSSAEFIATMTRLGLDEREANLQEKVCRITDSVMRGPDGKYYSVQKDSKNEKAEPAE